MTHVAYVADISYHYAPASSTADPIKLKVADFAVLMCLIFTLST